MGSLPGIRLASESRREKIARFQKSGRRHSFIALNCLEHEPVGQPKQARCIMSVHQGSDGQPGESSCFHFVGASFRLRQRTDTAGMKISL